MGRKYLAGLSTTQQQSIANLKLPEFCSKAWSERALFVLSEDGVSFATIFVINGDNRDI